VHTPVPDEPSSQLSLVHSLSLLQAMPFERRAVQIDVDGSQNVLASKQRSKLDPEQAWPADGPFVHWLVEKLHG
jgi:hypothetical protein